MTLKFNIHSISPVEESGGGGGVGSSDGITRQIDNGVWKMPYSNFTFKLPKEALDLDSYSLNKIFISPTGGNWTGVVKIDCSSLETITGVYACWQMINQCTSLQEVDFSNLKTITNTATRAFEEAFRVCTGITKIDFSNLETVSAERAFFNAFWKCEGIKNVTFPKLKNITSKYAMYNIFRQCTSLNSISFPSLTSTSFGSNTTQFMDMIAGVTGCTVHFPSNLQNVIGSWSDVTGGFGGTNTTVLFDLPATT